MDDDGVISLQGDALHLLVQAMQACDRAQLPLEEILSIVRDHLPDDDVSIEGKIMERLGQDDATTLIAIIYRALAGGATFSFADGGHSDEAIVFICTSAGIEARHVMITKQRRVLIEKPPS